MSDDRKVTVCSACLTASCWHGESMCSRAREASTIRVSRSMLDKLGKESPDNYSDEKLLAVCGEEP